MKRVRDFRDRALDTRDTRARFLIVCEGKRTEPGYFRSFRVNAVVKISGQGRNTLSLVEKAIELSETDAFDQVWCVFDRDSFPHDDFNAAIALAKKSKFKVAFTNEAFELWYLLHYSYVISSHTRREYISLLSKNLGFKYEKTTTLYDRLLDMQPQAIKNAKRLATEYKPFDPVSCNPSTTVHVLVEELNKHLIE
jgi:RloB-like protein